MEHLTGTFNHSAAAPIPFLSLSAFYNPAGRWDGRATGELVSKEHSGMVGGVTVSSGPEKKKPIRDQYSGYVICIDQSEARGLSV